MKYVLLVLSFALWQLPYAQTSEIGPASGPGSAPIETAAQAVQAALTFTGLDRYEELRVTAADDMAELMTFRESRIPTLGDSINGRKGWRVSFDNIGFDRGTLVGASKSDPDIELIEVFLLAETGQLIEVRTRRPESRTYPEEITRRFENETGWLTCGETLHGFCGSQPAVTLLEALDQGKLCSIDAHIMTARYVVESYVWRGQQPERPVWAISCLYPGTISSANLDPEQRPFSAQRLVVDAETGEALLEYGATFLTSK